MIGQDDKKFIDAVAEQIMIDLRLIITDYTCFQERMVDRLNERLTEINNYLYEITDCLSDIANE